MLGEDTLDIIAHCFAKHSTQTCKKFYVQFFSNREAARLSWKPLKMFTNIAKEEGKAIKMRKSKLCKTSIPSSEKIKSWYKDIRNVLKLSDDLDLTDKGLEALINQFKNEMRVDDDLDSNEDEDHDDKSVAEEVEEEEEEAEEEEEEVEEELGEPQLNDVKEISAKI